LPSSQLDVVRVPVLSGLRVEYVQPYAWEELDACPLCRRADHVLDVGIVEASEEGAVLAACRACRHGFMRHRPTSTWFDHFYAQEWDRHGRELVESDARTVRPDPKVVRFCAAELPGRARVLDVGAGFGAQLLAFREAGHEPHGVERSEHRAAYVRDRLGIPCETAPLESVELAGGYDLVFSHHVLEHVSDPRAALMDAARLLREGGLLYTAVPNVWHEYAPQTFHFVPHLGAFSMASLTALLAQLGLTVVHADEGRELQVLARKDGSPAAPDGGHHDFVDALERWALTPFRNGARERTLVWYKSPTADANYRARIVRWAWPLQVSHSLHHRAPPLRRLLPEPAASGSMRSLTVRGAASSLPVRLRYPGADTPVWIK
jgi:SAM-dependent methyltransferase